MSNASKKAEEPKELTAFKAKVRRVAERYGKDYDLCDTLDKALVELGIDPIKETYRVSFDIELKTGAKTTRGLINAMKDNYPYPGSLLDHVLNLEFTKNYKVSSDED